MAIAVIEDEAGIASFLRDGLEDHGFVVMVAPDGASGLGLALDPAVDVVILDLKLPVLDGEHVLDQLRRRRPEVPVIVLTAKDAVADRVRTLNAGADDYVTKPFSFSELVARIHARMRHREQVRATVLEAGPLSLDLCTRVATIHDRGVELSAREFALLETFLRHPGQVLSQAQLLDQVWGDSFERGSNVVEVYVRHLRRKLEPSIIETVRGAGYRLVR